MPVIANWPEGNRALLDRVRDAGCEVGLHGVKHDCRLFESRASFEAELGALDDSSFSDTDPFGPQAGGCCSILPYFLGDLVELPITLVQDHTLWEILGQSTSARGLRGTRARAHGALRWPASAS
jgi:hypothetical protein